MESLGPKQKDEEAIDDPAKQAATGVGLQGEGGKSGRGERT